MSTDYQYDDQGQFFPFFVVVITGLITIPLTYNVSKKSGELENTAPRIQTDYQPPQADLIDNQRRKQRRRERKTKRTILVTIGWAVMAYMTYLMFTTSGPEIDIWNPYDILGVSTSATEGQIRKKYKMLSLKMHPDKVRVDEAKNITKESANELWVEVTRAFKTLTDEDVRKNWEMYGNPDGKQSFSIGIALPKFIVEEGNGKYVLLIYASVLGIILPYLVGRWWYGTQSVTRDKVLNNSAANLFREYKEDVDTADVFAVLSSGDEYADVMKTKEESSNTAKADGILAGITSSEVVAQLSGVWQEQRRRVFASLWAYLVRVQLNDAALDEDKYATAPEAYKLSEAFMNMTLAFGNTQPLLSTLHAQQHLIQALAPGSSPLLQLPYFSRQIIEKIAEGAPGKQASLHAFMNQHDQQRRRLVVGKGLLTDSQYQTAMKVASQIPYAFVEKAFFKVVGEKFITPGSLISMVIKLRIIPPGTQNIPPVNELDLEDIDPKEGDLDALHGRTRKFKDESGKVIVKPADERVQPPLAHAPFYARDHAPRWRAFLSDLKGEKIGVPPFTFSTFDRPIFNEDGTPTFNVQTLKMQFGAPPQAGHFPFSMHLVCDSYIGLDTKADVTMIVEANDKAVEIVEEDEPSDPEEDSIAGQMQNLKGGKTSRKSPTADESDSGSDTEGDDADDDSDTDTDTDTDEE